MALLQKNFQPVSVDLPGFGASPLKKTETSMALAAGALQSLLEELFPGEKAVLCGLSMGGYVLFEFMKRFPEKARALILASTRASADSPEARANRFKLIEQVKLKGPAAAADAMLPKLLGKTALEKRSDLVEKVRALILKNSAEGIIAALKGMAARADSKGVLPGIKCPVLILAGEEDTLIPPDEIKSMKEGMPAARLEMIPQAGHLLNLEQPDAFHKAFVNFLKAKVL